DDNYKTPLIQQAIRMAAKNLRLPAGAVFHSDNLEEPHGPFQAPALNARNGPCADAAPKRKRSTAPSLAYERHGHTNMLFLPSPAALEGVVFLPGVTFTMTTISHSPPFLQLARHRKPDIFTDEVEVHARISVADS